MRHLRHIRPRSILLLASILVLAAVFAAAGQNRAPGSEKARPAGTAVAAPSAADSTAAKPAAPDSAKLSRPADTARKAALPHDTLGRPVKPADSLLHRGEQKKIKLQQHTYGRHQVLLAVFMMVFVAGIVTMAQQWNPH